MRIRGSSITSCSYSSASSSCYVAIPTNSFASSTNSVASSSSNFPSSSSLSTIDCRTRCEGLDILAEAVHFVAGSALPMGIPVTRRRVIIRRKSAFKINKIDISEIGEQEEVEVEEEMNQEEEEEAIGVITKPKRRKRVMAVPWKYQDSVLQPWKRQNRRRSIATEDD